MAQFASDSFTGSDGTELHTYSSSWTEHGSYTSGNIEINGNRAITTVASTNSLYYHSGTPASADYTVSADLYFQQANGGTYGCGVAGRINTGANTLYMARYLGGSGWQLYKFVGGTPTQLGSTVSASVSAGVTKNCLLSMVSDAIELFIDGAGTPTISVTDSAITSAGKAGLRGIPSSSPSSSSGIQWDNFSADDVGGVTYTLYSPTMVYSAGSWYPQVGETVA